MIYMLATGIALTVSFMATSFFSSTVIRNVSFAAPVLSALWSFNMASRSSAVQYIGIAGLKFIP